MVNILKLSYQIDNKIDDINFEEISRVKINSKSKDTITYAEFEINSKVEINYDEDLQDKKS